MDTLHLTLANAVFALHLAFILAVLPSTALYVVAAYARRPLLASAHVTAVFGMALGQMVLLECPLVPLERALRAAAGEAAWYHGSFTVFVLESATGFELPVTMVAALSILVMALTGGRLLVSALGRAPNLAVRP